MLFRDLFKTIPNGNYITLEIYDGSVVHFIKDIHGLRITTALG